MSRGKTHIQIAETMGIALTNVNKHIKKAIKKIQYENDCLPQDIKDKITKLKQIFGLKSEDILGTTEENVLHIFSNFPTLLSLNTNTVKNTFKIKDN